MNITIKVKERTPRTLQLTEHFGEGDLGKTHFEAYHTLPDMSIGIKVEGKEYLVNSQEIIQAVIEMHEKLNIK